MSSDNKSAFKGPVCISSVVNDSLRIKITIKENEIARLCRERTSLGHKRAALTKEIEEKRAELKDYKNSLDGVAPDEIDVPIPVNSSGDILFSELRNTLSIGGISWSVSSSVRQNKDCSSNFKLVKTDRDKLTRGDTAFRTSLVIDGFSKNPDSLCKIIDNSKVACTDGESVMVDNGVYKFWYKLEKRN